MIKTILLAVIILYSTATPAQDGHLDTLKQQLVKDWQRAKEYTFAFLNAMPADKYNWLPNPQIRSFASQMLHHTYITIGFVSNATGQERKLLGKILEKPLEESVPPIKDSVLRWVLAGYDFAIQGLQQMPSGALLEVGKRQELKITWINKAFEHQSHHRGQCVLYLRLAGVEPPHEQLF